MVSTTVNYTLLPERIRGAVERFIEIGILPGHFLRAVISNDLRDSFAKADSTNIARLFDIVSFFHNEAPGNCWGSQEKMIAWKDAGGLEGKGLVPAGEGAFKIREG